MRSPGAALLRKCEWFVLLYAVAVSALFVWVFPYTPATTALFTIAIGLPMLVRPRSHISAVAGVVIVLIGVVWLIVLPLRAG